MDLQILAGQAGVTAILAYLVKTWINGTAKEIDALKRWKLDKELFEASNERVLERIMIMKCDIEKIDSRLTSIQSDLVTIRLVRHKQMEEAIIEKK